MDLLIQILTAQPVLGALVVPIVFISHAVRVLRSL